MPSRFGARRISTKVPITPPIAYREPLWSDQSLWNSRPVNPVLGPGQFPSLNNFPWIEDGAFASRIYVARHTDPPLELASVWVADEYRTRSLVIPHWPSATIPPGGSDGHCNVFDPTTRIMHALYGLHLTNGVFSAGKYTSWLVDGDGFPTPSRPDGPMASGNIPCGGQMHIYDIGKTTLDHAIQFATHKNCLISGPHWPMTVEDTNSATQYTGVAPNAGHYGDLYMLPATFDESTLQSNNAKVIARTLKTYGARFVDQTTGTFSFSAEFMGGWSVGTGSVDIGPIRDAMRPVVSVDGWLDRNGNPFTPKQFREMNLLSMRGTWPRYTGTALTLSFDTVSNMVNIDANAAVGTHFISRTDVDTTLDQWWWKWGSNNQWYTNPESGQQYRFTCEGTGNAIVFFKIFSQDQSINYYNSVSIGVGQELIFTWPDRDPGVFQLTQFMIGKQPGPASSIRFELTLVTGQLSLSSINSAVPAIGSPALTVGVLQVSNVQPSLLKQAMLMTLPLPTIVNTTDIRQSTIWSTMLNDTSIIPTVILDSFPSPISVNQVDASQSVIDSTIINASY